MIRYLRYLFLAVLAACLLTVALANRDVVVLRALPVDIGAFLGYSWAVTLPLYLVILGGIVAGLMIGFVWEWFREHKQRAAAAAQNRELVRLQRELAAFRKGQPEHKDEVLALLDDARKAG